MYWIVVVCVIWAVVWVRNRSRTLRPPGYPGALPVIGNAHQIMGDTTYFWTKLKEISHDSLRQGGVTSVFLGNLNVCVITDPDDCATVAATCMVKPFLYDFISSIFSKALFLLKGQTWKRNRKVLNPLFNQSSLNNFLDLFNVHAKTLAVQLQKHDGQGPFIPTQYFIDSILRCVSETMLGLKKEDSNTATIYGNAMDKYLIVVAQRLQKLWFYVSQIYDRSSLKKEENKCVNIVHNISNGLLQKRKQELQQCNSDDSLNGKILVDLILKHSEFDDDEIRDHCDFIILASYDGTFPVLNYTLLLLGSHQDVQDKLFKELQEVLPSLDNDIYKYDMAKLVYLEAVIKESLRLYSSAPIVARQIDTEVKLKNHTLHKDTICVLSLYGVHRHPMWGADADQFRPERWLEPGGVPDNPNAFMAFSSGKRNCLGKHYAMIILKMYLAHILRRYRVKGDITKLIAKFEFLVKPVSGHEITLELRE